MSGGWPISFDVCNGTDIGSDTANSRGTKITTGGANTVGSWTQLVASTVADTCWLFIQLIQDNTLAASGFSPLAIDIGVGAAASEKVIIQQLSYGLNGTPYGAGSYLIPVEIPAGTRVSARCQASHANDYVYCSIVLFDGAFSSSNGYAGVDSLGFVSASTQGTTLTAGAANTKGSYSQLVASTAKDYAGIFFAMDNKNASTTTNGANMMVDLAIGAAASEVVILPNILFEIASAGLIIPNNTPLFWTAIPSGTRISARLQSPTASLSPCITAYGVYQ